MASQYLLNEVTIFAPSDGAMAKYKGPKDDNFILNHMGKKYLLSILFNANLKSAINNFISMFFMAFSGDIFSEFETNMTT